MLHHNRYLAREEILLSVVTHEFVGCYRDVHRTDKKVSAEEVKQGGMPPDPSRLALPVHASLFHITHDFYLYDFMTLLNNLCTRH